MRGLSLRAARRHPGAAGQKILLYLCDTRFWDAPTARELDAEAFFTPSPNRLVRNPETRGSFAGAYCG
jgi:hypothetical protein